jgi:hypothetical protein
MVDKQPGPSRSAQWAVAGSTQPAPAWDISTDESEERDAEAPIIEVQEPLNELRDQALQTREDHAMKLFAVHSQQAALDRRAYQTFIDRLKGLLKSVGKKRLASVVSGNEESDIADMVAEVAVQVRTLTRNWTNSKASYRAAFDQEIATAMGIFHWISGYDVNLTSLR